MLTVTKSDERIKSMIKANKELHELGYGYALFLFAKGEDINLKNRKELSKKYGLMGRVEKTIYRYFKVYSLRPK